MNADLEIISEWATNHGLLINAAKTQLIAIGSHHFVSKFKRANVPAVVFNGTPIPYSRKVKDLGLILDQTLSWSDHVDEVSRKLYASLHSLRRLQYFLPVNTKVMLAQSLLLPLLDYGDVAYLDLSEELLSKLERLQNQCIRFIFGLRKYDHISEYRKKLNWLPIRFRRESHILSFLYNVLMNPSSPSYLRERFRFRDIMGERLRAGTNLSLVIPVHCTKTYSDSFTVHGARLWNRLPTDVRKAPSVASFKNKLRKLLEGNDSQ